MLRQLRTSVNVVRGVIRHHPHLLHYPVPQSLPRYLHPVTSTFEYLKLTARHMLLACLSCTKSFYVFFTMRCNSTVRNRPTRNTGCSVKSSYLYCFSIKCCQKHQLAYKAWYTNTICSRNYTYRPKQDATRGLTRFAQLLD